MQHKASRTLPASDGVVMAGGIEKRIAALAGKIGSRRARQIIIEVDGNLPVDERSEAALIQPLALQRHDMVIHVCNLLSWKACPELPPSLPSNPERKHHGQRTQRRSLGETNKAATRSWPVYHPNPKMTTQAATKNDPAKGGNR